MPIGVIGQFEFSLDMDGRSDIIEEDRLDHYSLVERAGGALPEFELQFSTQDRQLLERLNEGSVFQVRVGDGRGKVNEPTTLKVTGTPSTQRVGSGEYIHTLRGTTAQVGYNLNQRIKITDRVTSVDAIREAIKPYFRADIDVTASDQMNWIQHNCSDRRFIYDTLMHMDIADSFPIIAVLADDRFRIRDARKLAASTPVLELGFGTNNPVDPDYRLSSAGSFLNSQGAYGIEQVESRMAEHDSFSQVRITQPVSNLLTRGSGLNRALETPTRRLQPVTVTDQMHPNYWEAWRRNTASLMAYSSTSLEVSARGNLLDVHPGDLVMFKDAEEGGNSTESYSGLYFVSTVGVTLTQRHIVTGLRLLRENINGAQGSLR